VWFIHKLSKAVYPGLNDLQFTKVEREYEIFVFSADFFLPDVGFVKILGGPSNMSIHTFLGESQSKQISG